MSLTILFCDDEADILDGLMFSTRTSGASTVTASSGFQAIELVKRQRFDIIVCDYLMPNGTGADVLQFLREHPEHFPGRFIFFTAHDNLIQDKEPGVEIVLKPDFRELLKRLTDLLQGDSDA